MTKGRNIITHEVSRRTRSNKAMVTKACQDPTLCEYIGVSLPIRTMLNIIRRWYDFKHNAKALMMMQHTHLKQHSCDDHIHLGSSREQCSLGPSDCVKNSKLIWTVWNIIWVLNVLNTLGYEYIELDIKILEENNWNRWNCNFEKHSSFMYIGCMKHDWNLYLSLVLLSQLPTVFMQKSKKIENCEY